MKKLILTSIVFGFLFVNSSDGFAQGASTQNVEVILGNSLDIDDMKLSPSRIPYVYANLNASEKADFVIYGRIESVSNDGQWIRISTHEDLDDIHCYVQAETNQVFNSAMLGKWVTAKGNISETSFNSTQLNQKNNNSSSLNNHTNPHTHLGQAFKIDADEILISHPF